MLKPSIAIFLAAALVSLSPLPTLAQKERPAVVRADLYSNRAFLHGDLASENLFSEQIIGTVESGLPAVVELFYRLVDREDNTVNGGVRVYELGYDVWEDRYLVKDMDSTAYYASFSQMSGAIEFLRGIKLLPLEGLANGDQYRLHFRVTVEPLRSRDREEMVQWMGQNMTGEVETSKRQMLNLNDLIQHFFAREKDGSNQSAWYQTEFFTPGTLPARDLGASP